MYAGVEDLVGVARVVDDGLNVLTGVPVGMSGVTSVLQTVEDSLWKAAT